MGELKYSNICRFWKLSLLSCNAALPDQSSVLSQSQARHSRNFLLPRRLHGLLNYFSYPSSVALPALLLHFSKLLILYEAKRANLTTLPRILPKCFGANLPRSAVLPRPLGIASLSVSVPRSFDPDSRLPVCLPTLPSAPLARPVQSVGKAFHITGVPAALIYKARAPTRPSL